MKEKYIGIIIKNQEDKILLYKNSYYIKVKLSEGEDVDFALKNAIEKSVNQSMYRIVKSYDKALKKGNYILKEEYEDSDIKMYVVEVVVHNDKLKFVKTQEMLSYLKKSPSKDFYEYTMIKYIPYKDLAESLLAMIMIFLSTVMMFSVNHLDSKTRLPQVPFMLQLTILVVIFIIVFKYLTPILVGYFMKSKLDIRRSKVVKNLFTAISIIIMMGVATGMI